MCGAVSPSQRRATAGSGVEGGEGGGRGRRQGVVEDVVEDVFAWDCRGVGGEARQGGGRGHVAVARGGQKARALLHRILHHLVLHATVDGQVGHGGLQASPGQAQGGAVRRPPRQGKQPLHTVIPHIQAGGGA